ncbi:crotonase/enoyl-CoA hydratase family protein [Congregibacter brevis]|uniref:Crotonase/enoyl-CoA hydratase family protein n=1 Tax=Congregibacter brevis TaxID=3081201 RepID=A0ABZ0IHB4_9GAMM|nr:crotonase/enoyl-CoA hydratase family protein [Congregibacter sp. IMCC45268]
MTVLVERVGRVLKVLIDRPENRNAVNGPTASLLARAFRDFDRDDSLDVAILQGGGETFCAGADLKAVASGENMNRMQAHGEGPMGPSRMQLSKPVIAAVEGHAVAGGLELALWCDLRVADPDAVFGVFCRRWGVPLVDGGTVRLPRLIGQSRAMDMILTGRPVGAREALEMGLVNRVSAPGEVASEALALAEQLSAFPQACMRADRASALAQWSLTEQSALAHEYAAGEAVVQSGETRRGAERFSGGLGRHGDFRDI